jgi:hypothetical protein
MNPLIPSRLSRRGALTRLVMAAGAATIPGRQALQADASGAGDVTFYVVADPQIHLEKWMIFMCPSPQRDRNPKTPEVPSTPKGFLVVRLQGDELQLAHHTDTGWAETWKRKVV